MQKRFNKKAGKYLSPWMIFVWVLIAGGIFFGISIFYSANVNVKNLEADILMKKIGDCVSDENNIEKWLLDKDSDLIEKCNLNRIHFGESSNYFVKVSVSEFDSKKKINEFKAGNNGFEKDCDVKKGLISADNFPECVENSLVLNDEGKLYFIEIISSSKAEGSRRYDEK